LIDEILNVAKELWAIKEPFGKAKEKRRAELATYFEHISKCLEEAAKVLRAGDIPHGKCGEMLGYANTFTRTIKGVISEQEAEDFAKRLGAAHGIEYAVQEIADARAKESQIGKIEEASGVFRALANSIRAR
jgi:hypothetical protein